MSRTMSPGRLLNLAENRLGMHALSRLVERLTADSTHSSDLVYLHGPSGCGKTVLVQSAVDDLLGRDMGHAVALVSARDLAPAKDSPIDAHLLEELARADLAVLEDLQFLPLSAAPMVAAILDERTVHDRATIVTASVGPRHLTHRGERFPARLSSRLAAGLVVPLQPLQASSRLRLLQHFAQKRQLAVPGDLLVWLADHLTCGGRQLEGAVTQLETLNRLDDGLLHTEAVRKHFETQIDAQRPSIERIAAQVSEYFQITPRELLSRRRFRNIVVPRQVGMYLSRQRTTLSLQKIGDYFGGHDHSTVVHACQKIEETMKSDAILSGAVAALESQLG